MYTLESLQQGTVITIDKPLHWTSFQAVNKIRWAIRKAFDIKRIKVGHAGTLDPLATGLLILCTGKMTKQIASIQVLTKVYSGVMRLGSTTPSYDLETAIDKHFPTDHINDTMIHETCSKFIGDIEQLPPIFSAVKKDGKRLYELARADKTTEIEPRRIRINSFEITGIDHMNVAFRVSCSKGTYIRSLVHDFGKALGSGAHLIQLRREMIGDYDVKDAKTIEDVVDEISKSGNAAY